MRRYVKPGHDRSKTMAMVVIAATLMIAIKTEVWRDFLPGKPPAITQDTVVQDYAQTAPHEPPVTIPDDPCNADVFEVAPPENHGISSFSIEQDGKRLCSSRLSGMTELPAEQGAFLKKPILNIVRPSGQNWKKFRAAGEIQNGNGARIVVIIDDMGVDKRRSHRVIDIDAPLTLAFLPYAGDLQGMTLLARERGHELMIHVPMEPLDPHTDPGPGALRAAMSPEDFGSALDSMFNSFEGYVGINNHMGSKLTRDKASMNRVMNALAVRGLLFVDSKTIGDSVAAETAAEHGIDYAVRDVFLDHREDPGSVYNSLREAEGIALKRGYAVAIGHPKDATIQALQEWIPDAKQRGFRIVPVSDIVRNEINSGATKVHYGPDQAQDPLP